MPTSFTEKTLIYVHIHMFSNLNRQCVKAVIQKKDLQCKLKFAQTERWTDGAKQMAIC